MKILLITPNFSPEKIGCGKYNFELFQTLGEMGHEVHALVSKPHYPNAIEFEDMDLEIHDKAFGGRLHRMDYEPRSTGSLIIRFMEAIKFFFAIKKFSPKTSFDLVIVVAPYIIGLLAVEKIATNQTKKLLHIQDDELNFLKTKFPIFPFNYLIRCFQFFIFSKADAVSTISKKMADRISRDAGRHDVAVIRNWANDFITSTLGIRRKEFKLLCPELNFLLTARWPSILYSGNVGSKQGLEILLKVIPFLERYSVKVIIIGNGNFLSELKGECADYKNIFYFFDFIPQKYFDILVQSATVNFVPQRKSVEDLVFPSKIHNLLALNAKILVGCSAGSELRDLSVFENKKVYEYYEPENHIDLEEKLVNMFLKNEVYFGSELADSIMNREKNISKFLRLYDESISL